MSIESIIVFSLAMLILAATPRPGIFAAVSQALSSGFRSSLFLIAGIVFGDIFFLMLAAFGLSVVAHLLGAFFFIVKLFGSAYLIWLGWKMWTHEPKPLQSHKENIENNGRQIFFGGLFITLGNPKVILFYMGFLPGFMNLASFTILNFAILAGVVTTVLFGVIGTYSYLAARVSHMLISRRASKNLNWVLVPL